MNKRPKRVSPTERSSKRRTTAWHRKKQLTALKAESRRVVVEQVRLLLALPPEKRTHFLRARLRYGATAL